MSGATLRAVEAEPRRGIRPQPKKSFVDTPAVKSVAERASAYLDAGYPVHFRGPAGAGKTTLAFHVASLRERPIMLMAGDEEFETSDLIGARSGVRSRRVVDRYIRNVVKVEEDVDQKWVDNRLTTACVEGHTLIYDEFTRSRPAANNVLLSILEEKLLVLPGTGERGSYVKVHPEFRAIFTSNPVEYVGVHKTQDALADRMITVELDGYDRVTEVAITVAHSGLSIEDSAVVVDIVRSLRETKMCRQSPTIRATIMIARIAARSFASIRADDRVFVQICRDVLESKIREDAAGGRGRRKILNGVIARVCGVERGARERRAAREAK